MKKKKPFLTMYEKYMKDLQLGYFGLCNCIKKEYPMNASHLTEVFDHLKPTTGDFTVLRNQNKCDVFWGSGLPSTAEANDQHSAFTPLRQTILLFCAAINEEL